MFNIVFHPDVSLEIKSSFEWYESLAKGLGEDFLTELEASYETVAEHPHTWPKFQFGFRRFVLSRFPFSVIYRLKNQTIFVIAIMHNNRKPGYWADRI